MADAPQTTFARWLPFLAVGVPIVGALASLYLMTNTAYSTATSLEARVRSLEVRNQAQDIQIRSLCSSLVEVETQFRADRVDAGDADRGRGRLGLLVEFTEKFSHGLSFRAGGITLLRSGSLLVRHMPALHHPGTTPAAALGLLVSPADVNWT